MNSNLTLEEALNLWDVLSPGMWENEQGPQDWYAVANDEGIVAYFAKEADACRFRISEVNRMIPSQLQLHVAEYGHANRI